MSDVGLVDIASRVPGVLADVPVIVRGVVTGLLARPTSKTSIGKVFQARAARYGNRVFLRFGDQQLTYREANEAANRYAAVLAARGVGHGDVVGIMLRNSPSTVLMMLAVVKCGAIAGMLNYHQRGEVLAHSLGLLDAKVLVAESDLVEALTECGNPGPAPMTIEEMDRLASTAPTANPPSASAVLAKDTAFYIFTSGTTGHPKASVMSHRRWLAALAAFGGLGLRLKGSDTLYSCLPLYHNNALTVAVSSVINSGATLALGRSFSASRFWDEVIASDATAFIYIGEVCRYLLNQPAKPTDRAHKVRVIAGNGLRPEIWEEFTARFGIGRVCEFYAASEGNTAFINIFNVPKSTGVAPMPLAYVRYDPDTGAPLRDERGRVMRAPAGEPGLLLSPVNKLQPFDGYTDPAASEKKLVRNAFREGDCWFNTGDVMSPQGMGHAAFVDRLGDTFRWKGENVATTQVEAVVGAEKSVEECAVFGVEVPRTGGRAGMAAVKLRDGAEFDGKELARCAYEQLPPYALPLFIRVVDSMEHTTTFKSRKVDLREQAYGPGIKDPIYVLAGRDEGYVPFYDEYPDEVAAGKRPRG
ncbi:long-chain-acyl-CoA synthetase FadD6 [Mycobacterium shimoidei]|uniref:Putative fatty-acid-CoA ligase FadD6 (Fatty-acid-CoA synthetase) (Fatty-acid-CoA synthase) [Mycobacterium tuberculosis H37Rv] n=1 Tax=Mycobacterium shimoidei TaxID=29313 RepID=A0A1E3THR0_MYCSH|nr:long-chain-acyl-CoA synthetase FadD6 [Mycobacterium shimoidei]MCV7257498.1 long-chain-acyl-CoA synthetase [Mycobacterium shimoidei]ODR13972.1 long-chain-acyl-CoA synthetase [Mycobacterium shimoidei]ORW82559.1 long-chain-acyl-CoA synthetase [Mycobacterium shimoidei]SRX94171.1 putative fatty-acid-CoA ligase FadD6 (fatty-acid-CoA synthetase) (fatty-acid-CoA synthase) [Mycobacterium tuberculosis H37Rv] [Mycobacterium shimoidei]